MVLPDWMGLGIGWALLSRAQTVATGGGGTELAIGADPNALDLYLAGGARVVGCVPTPIEGEPGRVRPQLRLPTAAA